MTGATQAALWEFDAVVDRGAGLPPARIQGSAPAPTAGQALAVLSASEAGKIADPAALRTAGRSWLPLRLWSDLAPLSDAALAQALLSFVALASGVDVTRAARQEAASGERPEPASADWGRLARRVAHGYGWTLAETLALPWADFLDAAADLPALQAQQDLRAVSAAHPSKSGLDRLARLAAGGRQEAPPAAGIGGETPWGRLGMTKEAYRKREMKDLHRVQEAMRKLRPEA